MGDFHDLKVWQKAHELTLQIYRTTADFPPTERYGLTPQLRRACASIAANLAEGCGRNGTAELARFSSIALGSANEVAYYLLLSKDLNLIPNPDYEALNHRITQIKRMLAALIHTLRTDS